MGRRQQQERERLPLLSLPAVAEGGGEEGEGAVVVVGGGGRKKGGAGQRGRVRIYASTWNMGGGELLVWFSSCLGDACTVYVFVDVQCV